MIIQYHVRPVVDECKNAKRFQQSSSKIFQNLLKQKKWMVLCIFLALKQAFPSFPIIIEKKEKNAKNNKKHVVKGGLPAFRCYS